MANDISIAMPSPKHVSLDKQSGACRNDAIGLIRAALASIAVVYVERLAAFTVYRDTSHRIQGAVVRREAESNSRRDNESSMHPE